jgi:hypothetical protein
VILFARHLTEVGYLVIWVQRLGESWFRQQLMKR